MSAPIPPGLVRLTEYDGGAYFKTIRAGPGTLILYDPTTNVATLGSDPRQTIRRVAGNADVLATDQVVVVDASTAATVRLLPVADRVGLLLTVARHSPNGAVDVVAAGADLIWGPGVNGMPSVRLQSRGAVVQLLGETATTWRVVMAGGTVQMLDAPGQLPAT